MPLRDQFLSSASGLAQSAVREFQAENWTAYAISAGISLEHLMKAYLAGIHPTLAVEGFDSMLFAIDHPTKKLLPPSILRTVGLVEALKRCSQLLPRIDLQNRAVRMLLDARNSAAHAGVVEDQQLPSTLGPYVRVSGSLLEALEEDAEAFWGGFTEVARLAVSATVLQDEVRVSARLATARQEMDRRFGPDGPSAEVVAAIEAGYSAGPYEEQPTECPVGSHKALATGHLNVTWEPDFDFDRHTGEGWVAGVYPVVEFISNNLHCRICDLRLDGAEQLRIANVPEDWIVEDVDPADFAFEEEWEQE